MLEYSVAILAGGFNSRMGYQNKAFLKIGDTTFIEYILKKVCIFDDVFIVTSSPDQYRHLKVRIVIEEFPHLGPLGAISEGLKKARHERMLVLPCDMPFINENLLVNILEKSKGYDGLVPRLNGHYEPLCAVYSQSCQKIFSEGLNKNIRKIIDLYPLLSIYYMELEEIKRFGKYEKMFANINTYEEYLKLINMYFYK